MTRWTHKKTTNIKHRLDYELEITHDQKKLHINIYKTAVAETTLQQIEPENWWPTLQLTGPIHGLKSGLGAFYATWSGYGIANGAQGVHMHPTTRNLAILLSLWA